MEPTAIFSVVTGFVSVFKPPIITLINHLWIKKHIKEEEPRNAALLLIVLIVGGIIAILINIVGNFGLNILDCLIIGTPAAFAGGQIGHRAIKFKNGKLNGKNKERNKK